nr:RNHCP domain-containing protein [uncultured Oscillibacter sp.]
MDRENKERSFEKSPHETHPCRHAFVCKVCGRPVAASGAGSAYRNHCPYCLSSRHLDIEPGDREAGCGGTMEPIAVWVRKGGEWAIIHRCKICGALRSNRIAADDDPMKLMSLAMKPVASPPFPLERIEEMVQRMGGEGTCGR